MPLEFSAAAFRIGHTMVRSAYQWNQYHAKGENNSPIPAVLPELFGQTAFSGRIGKRGSPDKPPRVPALPTDWIIDWRRFYEFPEGSKHRIERSRINMARALDTHFDFRLDQMFGFPHGDLPPEKQSIPVRNLLRGLALGLPSGEQVAGRIGAQPLTHDELASEPYRELLSAPALRGRTPLWYYILKEAEQGGGNSLGPVGGYIVAETLVGLIKHSRHTILDAPDWRPTFTERRDEKTGTPVFEMVDLLQSVEKSAQESREVINPLGGD
jgi:hypothetical protein